MYMYMCMYNVYRISGYIIYSIGISANRKSTEILLIRHTIFLLKYNGNTNDVKCSLSNKVILSDKIILSGM